MSRVLEITILSAEELRMNRKRIKKNVFVCVQSLESSNTWTTAINSKEGSYLSWNEKFEMEVPVHARLITAEVKEKTAMGITSVGTARIPVSDFIGSYVPENQLHFLSYRLWDSKCRRNGVINISVRVKAPEHSCSMSHTVNTGVVTGIPVWLNYPAKY